MLLGATVAGLAYGTETTDVALETRYAALAAGTAGVTLTRAESVTHLRPTLDLAEQAGAAAGVPHDRRRLLASLDARGFTDRDRLRALLVASGSAPASLNALYALVAYRIEATAGFEASNLSTPVQAQKPTETDTTGQYRIVAPLYAVATANAGAAMPDRYAAIGAAYQLSCLVCDAFGNALPTPLTETGTNLYFDPLVPLDQWQGLVPSYDFSSGAAATLTLRLAPSTTAFSRLSAEAHAAAAAHYRTIGDQIDGPGVSFFVETSLAPTTDGSGLTEIPIDATGSAAIRELVAGMLAYLTGASGTLPATMSLEIAVPQSAARPPLLSLSVLFGIERRADLLSPEVAVAFPAARIASNAIVADLGSGGVGAFAAAFTTAFPALRLAVCLGDPAAPPSRARNARHAARVQLRGAQAELEDTTNAASDPSLWAVSTSLLDITIGAGSGSGPRYLSPKPLDNALRSETIPLPSLASPLPSLARSQLFVDIDLDRLNSVFFQALDDALAPASAAKAFALSTDHAVYNALARGRSAIATGYANNEVDWLFDEASPFTGTDALRTAARAVFAAQMRAALMSAYGIDTLVQYDVAWQGAVPQGVGGKVELFGTVEAVLAGSYRWSGALVTCATQSPHGLSDGDKVLISFVGAAGSTAPAGGLDSVAIVDPTHFTVTATTTGNGSGSFSAARQDAGLSTAHVAIVEQGTSPLTFFYGNPDAARTSQAASVALDLRYTVSDLQLFLADQPDEPDAARPSIWLHLVDPVATHVGPSGPTTIPIVFRQYPTVPTFIGQGWTPPTSVPAGTGPIAAAAAWRYVFSYQAMLAAQDRIDAALTYNTNLRTQPGARDRLRAGTGFSLFAALARFSAVYAIIQPILPKPDDSRWNAAIEAMAACVGEVAGNTDWHSAFGTRRLGALGQLTDGYVVTDRIEAQTNRRITLAWPAAQGPSSFAGVTLAIEALDPASSVFPLPASAYPDQGPVTPSEPDSLAFAVPDAPIGPAGVAHRVTVDGLDVLAAENAIAAIRIERNRLVLDDTSGTPWQALDAFVYKTPQVRPSQPVTPYIDAEPPPYLDVATLPAVSGGTLCPASPSSLCRRILAMMTAILADPTQAPSLASARAAKGQDGSSLRRVKVGCAFQFALASVSGSSDRSIVPRVPVKLARSFEIDGGQSDQIEDFAALFAGEITAWAADKAIVFGSAAMPSGAALLFEVMLYAGLSGVNTPVLRLGNLRLALKDIDAV